MKFSLKVDICTCIPVQELSLFFEASIKNQLFIEPVLGFSEILSFEPRDLCLQLVALSIFKLARPKGVCIYTAAVAAANNKICSVRDDP